jgi:enediyne biosynthesis protein E4
LELISSTSNITRRPLFWGLLVLAACASPVKRNEDLEAIKLSEELSKLSREVQQVNYGPTVQNGGFQDKTEEYGLGGLTAVNFNAVDLNQDGLTDLVILPTYYSRPLFFLFDPKLKKFVPWAHDPLSADFKASFLLIYDLNKDDVPDLVAGVLNQKSEVSKTPVKVYFGEKRNGLLYFVEKPGTLEVVAEPTGSVSIIDYDLDGWPDLFIGNWYESKQGQFVPTRDRLFRNRKGKFEEVTSTLQGEADKLSDHIYPPNAKPTYGSSTCDIDQNGFPDILTVSSSGHRNKLWMNLKHPVTGQRFFEDIGASTNYGSDPDGSLIPTGGGRTFFSACADYNDDGIMDVFMGELSHAYDNESVDKSSVLTGSKETYPPYFIRTEYVSDANSESWNQGDRRAIWVDYNLDGRLDILVDNSGFPPHSRLVLFEQDETRAFFNVASQRSLDIVNPSGTIVIDLNRDGRPDIITAQNSVRRAEIPQRIYVFENQLDTQGKRSLKVNLHGLKSNTSALGAMVMLYTRQEGRNMVHRRWVEYSQGGLPAQNESGILFGIPEGTEVLGVKVRWPFVQKDGRNLGVVLEKMYQIKPYMGKSYSEITLCEDGKVLRGKMSCRF